jgi:lipopolysaccharide export system protein LptA
MLLAGLLATAATWAQDGAPAEPPIEIFGDNGRLDVPSGAYVLNGNVRILRGSLSVYADEARSFNGESGEIERVELYGTPTRWDDVLEDGSEVRGESDEILYDFIGNLITMRGNAEIVNVQGRFSGNQLVYDLDTQNLVGDGGVRLLIEPATAQAATEQISGNDPEIDALPETGNPPPASDEPDTDPNG